MELWEKFIESTKEFNTVDNDLRCIVESDVSSVLNYLIQVALVELAAINKCDIMITCRTLRNSSANQDFAKDFPHSSFRIL